LRFYPIPGFSATGFPSGFEKSDIVPQVVLFSRTQRSVYRQNQTFLKKRESGV